jgi:septal ring-binding cell division protein DamX
VVAEPEEDLAAQAAAELSTQPAAAPTEVTPAASAAVSGYLFSETDLLAMSGQAVALQLVVFSNDVAQQTFVRNNPQLKTYTYQRSKNGQRQLVVLLAPFADAAAAKAKIATLPAPLQQAFVKSLADIHSEISTQ